MTEQPASGNGPHQGGHPPASGDYPPLPPGNYPPPPPGNYPPPPPGNYPPPPPGNYPPPAPGQGYTPYAHGGYVDIPGVGVVPVAGIGQRLLARLIDSVIYFVVYWILFSIGVASVGLSGRTVTDAYGNSTTEPSGAGLLGLLLALVLALAFGLLYEWLMVGLLGATLGKMALGVKVVNQSTGAVIGLGLAFVRQIIPFLGGLFCYIGALIVYLSPLFDNSGRLQGWHDKAANDLVIKSR